MKKIQDIDLDITNLKPGENFRTIIDQSKIDDLSRNIEEHGILNPLTVRIVDKQYVVVAGKRRLWGAQKAGLKKVPCSIYDMTDAEAQEMQLIENLQREDMHAIDEARGYVQLIKTKMMDPKVDEKAAIRMVSSLIGKPEVAIRKRTKLMLLIDDAQTMFKNGVIGYDEAILICRTQQEDQKKILKSCWWGSGKDKKFYTANILKAWIHRNLFLQMSKAPFPLDDATLFVQAGACTVCPKRSKNEQLLFDDMVEGDTCTDGVCFNKKIANFISLRKEEVQKKFVDRKVLVGKTTYNSDEVLIGDTRVKTVNPKQFPSAVPVIITEAYSTYDNDKVGKTTFVLPDLKNPKIAKSDSEEKLSAKEKDRKEEQEKAGKQCVHFRIAVIKEIYKIFQKPGEVKFKKGGFSKMLQTFIDTYGMDEGHAYMLVTSGKLNIPLDYNKDIDDFIAEYETTNRAAFKKSMQEVEALYEKIGIGKSIMLIYAMGSMFTYRDIGNANDNVGEVAEAIGLDYKKLKPKFLVEYKKQLADAQKKKEGKAISDLLKPTDGMKKAAAKSTTLPKKKK